MGFITTPLPVSAGDGVGADVSVAAMGGLKTITVEGVFTGDVTIEVSLDGGATHAPVFSFDKTTKGVFFFAADTVRVRRSNTKKGAEGTPVVDVSANDNGAMFAALPSGGVPVDVSALGNGKIVTVANLINGGALNVEVSDDGVLWTTCMSFDKNSLKQREFTGMFMRQIGTGATVNVGAANDAGSGAMDELVKVDGADAASEFLDDKILVVGNISKATVDKGGGVLATELSVPFPPPPTPLCDDDPQTVRGAINSPGTATDASRCDHGHRLEYEIEDEGVLVTARPRLNVVGVGATVVDDAPNDRSVLTIPGTSDGGFMVCRSLYVAGSVSTSSNSFVDGSGGGSVTVPIDGDYKAIWEGESENQSGSGVLEVGISVNSLVTPEVDSERETQGNASDMRPFVSSVLLPGLTAGDLVRGLFRKSSGSGSVSLHRRNLILMAVQ